MDKNGYNGYSWFYNGVIDGFIMLIFQDQPFFGGAIILRGSSHGTKGRGRYNPGDSRIRSMVTHRFQGICGKIL